MNIQSEKELKSFIKVKQYVRIKLDTPADKITDQKIMKFCRDQDYKSRPAVNAIKVHIEFLNKTDFAHIGAIPEEKVNESKLYFIKLVSIVLLFYFEKVLGVICKI